MDDLRVIPRPPQPAPLPGGGRRARAARALRVAADSLSQPASGTGREIVTVPERRCGTVWFDYTDLLHYFEDNRVPTGIQRVQIGIFQATLVREVEIGAERIGACGFDRHRHCWVALPETLLVTICRAACQTASHPAAGCADESWRALMAALQHHIAGSAAAPFAPGDVLVNIGSSWWIPDYLLFVRHLQRERGVLFASFVHDCIPLRVPETCAANLVDEFSQWFGAAMRTADFVLANSAHTARDVAALAPAHGGRGVNPQVIRLDARFDDGPQPGVVAAARLDATTHAAMGIRRPFALFVSTLEARKNHLFVFQCWLALIERHGDAVPDLICVGKKGWLFDYTQNWLEVHPVLRARVRLVGTLSDNDVAALYRTAQFTVYCSHYEGWGLPITESLCYGRVPVVPNHTALPEAGGPFAAYYEPGSQAEFCAQVELLMDRRRRGEMEARVRARYRPRAWSDVLGQIVATVRETPVRAGREPEGFVVRPGRIYSLARLRPGGLAEPGVEPGGGLRHGIGWHAAEDWGGWSRQAEARLLLTLPSRARELVLYVMVRNGPAEQTLQVRAGGTILATVTLQPTERRLLRRKLDGAAAGTELLLSFAAPPYSLAAFTGGGDPREIGFGLECVAVAEQRDAASRVEVLEHFLAGNR